MEVRKIEEASKKIGGYYKLTTLVQKRVKELVRGSAPAIDTTSNNPIEIAIEEVLQGKIQTEVK